jgi:hypothetical protein
MDAARVYLTKDSTFQPGENLRFGLDENGGLRDRSRGGFWAKMRYREPDSKEMVPLAFDSEAKNAYFESHWPALVAAERGKRSPAIKLLLLGGGAMDGLPDESGHVIPAIFQIMKLGYRGWDDASLNKAFAKPQPYAKIEHGGRNILELALAMRLYGVAEALWDKGIGFSEGALKSGSMVRALSNPIVEGEEAGLYDAVVRMAGKPAAEETGDERDDRLANALINQTSRWLQRLDEAGVEWDTGHELITSNSSEGTKFNLNLKWPATIARFRLKDYQGKGNHEKSLSFLDEHRQAWESMWMKYLYKIPKDTLGSPNCLDDEYRITAPITLASYFGVLNKPNLAGELDQWLLEGTTPAAMRPSMAKPRL